MQPLAARDAKPIVDEIKAKLKGKKFYPGSHAEPRTVHFSTPRFPLDKAEQLFGVGADGKPAARKFKGEQIAQVLRLKPDALKATLYKKPHRFAGPGATAKRWGIASLTLLSMDVTYKAGTLHGRVHCINAPDPEEVAFEARAAAREKVLAEMRASEDAKADAAAAAAAATGAGQERPAVGDVCEILNTPRIRNIFRGIIGRKVTIMSDDHSDCPLRVCYNRSEAPYPFHPSDLRLVARAADNTGEPRRILEFSANKLKVLCPDCTCFMNFHRALQTCIQACKGVNAVDFRFDFNGHVIRSDGSDEVRFLSELKVGDVITYTSVFNKSYGSGASMHLKVTGACVAPASAGETPWERPRFLDDDFLPRCVEATAEKTRDTANWRLCHMRFDRLKYPTEFERDDMMITRFGPEDRTCGSGSRRPGPGKHQREAVVKRMSLDLAGELDIAKTTDNGLSDVSIDR